MWTITTDGFVSLVEHKTDPDIIRARARRVEHLQDTFDLNDADIIDLGADCPDYRYHADIPRLNVAQKMYDAVMNVGYASHVKEEVAAKDGVFYRAMLGCWRELYTLQDPPKSGMVLDQEALLAGTGRWGEPDVGEPLARQEYPTFGELDDLATQIGDLADKMRGSRPHGYVLDELDDPFGRPVPDLLEHPDPLEMFVWGAATDETCLICGEDLRLGDHYVDLPEDLEFDEPAGPAHPDCAEDEGWQVQR